MEGALKTVPCLPCPPTPRNECLTTPPSNLYSEITKGLCDRVNFCKPCILRPPFLPHFLFFSCGWGKQTGWEERGGGTHMTLELVELLGHRLLGGNTLAAAAVFSPECTRLMYALGVQWFWSSGEFWRGEMCSCTKHDSKWVCWKGLVDYTVMKKRV